MRATKTSTIELRDTAAALAAGATTETTIAGLVRTLRRAGASADVSYSYDSLGRIETVTDPLSGSLTSVYDAGGQLESVTDSAATPRTTRYTYYGDGVVGAGQVATVTDAADVVTRIAYTVAGQRYRQWGSGVMPTQSTYDGEGRLTELRTFRSQDTQNGGSVDWSQETWPANAPEGDLTQWVYDAPSGLLEFKRAADYNAADATPIQQSYSFDAALRLRVRTNARGQTATYGYDDLGQMTTIAYSAGSGAANATLGYDRAGRLSRATDGSGARTLTLTAFGQPDDDSYTTGLLAGLTVARSFDANRRPAGVAVTGAVALAYGYDDYSRLSTITDTREAAALLFTYGYTAGTGRVETVEARRAAALRLTAKRTFDTLGRLSGTETRNASNQVLVSHGYSGFDALDRRTAVDREDGKRWDYGYDARGEVTSAAKRFPDSEGGQALAGWSASYLYDSIGNRIAASDFTSTLPDAGSSLRADYTTNAINEYEQRTVTGRLSLTGDAAAAAVVAVAVNEAPLTVTRQGAAGAEAFWAADWQPVNAATPAFGQVRVQATVAGRAPAGSVGTLFLPQTPEVFSHDRDGNLTQDGRWNYTWDAENRLITMETRPELMQPVGVLPVEQRTKLEFAYDFTGRRVGKQVFTWNLSLGTWNLASDTRFLYDGWNLLAEYTLPLGTSNLVLQRSYTWGLDLSGSFQGAGGVGGLLAIHQPAGAVHLPAFDGNGNLAAAFDAGTLSEVARFDYDAFGRTLQAVGSAVAAIPFRFSTKYTDSESGLLYYGFRYYNTSTGRWLSRDPIGENGGVNLYGLVRNSPVNKVDILGLKTLLILVGEEYDNKSAIFENAAQKYAGEYRSKSDFDARKDAVVIIRLRGANAVDQVRRAFFSVKCIGDFHYFGHGSENALFLSGDKGPGTNLSVNGGKFSDAENHEFDSTSIRDIPTWNVMACGTAYLGSCYAAKGGENSFAQGYSNHFGREVWGGGVGVSYRSDGTPFIGVIGMYRPYWPAFRVYTSADGWNLLKPKAPNQNGCDCDWPQSSANEVQQRINQNQ